MTQLETHNLLVVVSDGRVYLVLLQVPYEGSAVDLATDKVNNRTLDNLPFLIISESILRSQTDPHLEQKAHFSSLGSSLNFVVPNLLPEMSPEIRLTFYHFEYETLFYEPELDNIEFNTWRWRPLETIAVDSLITEH